MSKTKITSKKIGVLKAKYLNTLNIQICKCKNVYISPGAERHIKNRHTQDYNNYFNKISDIIINPDFIGINPHISNSIEMIKILNDIVLLSIAININGFLYISSMYSIGQHQLNSRLKKGRLISAP
ncbi:MAG: PBECR2 nuclease fold domain-containing protein [Actinobacteria bacterium]|nr:PBECR2 nuclease fold domain-containing protein [Actinomycetota bacterium]